MKAMNNKGKVKKWYKLINGKKQRSFESNNTSRRKPDPRIDSFPFFFVIAQKTREGTERKVPVLITERYSKDGKLQMF